MSENICIYWCHGPGGKPNLGDESGPYIINKLTGLNPVKVSKNHTEKYLVTIGSVADNINENGIIISSGMIDYNLKVGEGKVVGVRGKLSQEEFKKQGKNVDIIEDFALLLSYVYPKFICKNYKKSNFNICFLPHYVDYLDVKEKYENVEFTNNNIKYTVTIIDILQNVEQVIDEIIKSNLLITSSLHGLITAHSYDIPVIPVKFSEKLVGGEFKFLDYLSTFIDINISKCRFNFTDFPTLTYNLIENLMVYSLYIKLDNDKLKNIQKKQLEIIYKELDNFYK